MASAVLLTILELNIVSRDTDNDTDTFTDKTRYSPITTFSILIPVAAPMLQCKMMPPQSFTIFRAMYI